MNNSPFAPLTNLPVAPFSGTIPEGKIVDFLTGKIVNDNPEEYVRQNLEKALVRQYRYDPKLCLPEFPIVVGSSRKRVDIVVFNLSETRLQEHAFLLVETKKQGISPKARTDGIDQLKSYMAACINAKYGLWTNGEERFCFARQIQKKSVELQPIVDIPIFGQTAADAERPKRRDLMPATAHNLLFAFRRCHNYIAGTEGMQKPEAFWELLKLIFCKIEDERSGDLKFYVTAEELVSPEAAIVAKERIERILEERVLKKHQAVFVNTDREINLKANVVSFVVAQLQRYSLLNSPVDVKGIAYEEIVGSNLRGDRGEFFTPRNACRMAVDMLDPRPSEKLLDPACGTGGFLISAMNHALTYLDQDEKNQWNDSEHPTELEKLEHYKKRGEYCSQKVFGFDLNPALVRAAKMNMVMNNDGEGGLYQANSLSDPRTYYQEATQVVPLGSIDVLFTNPPFGANIVVDERSVLAQFDLAAIWNPLEDGSWQMRLDAQGDRVLQKSLPPEILFIERCVQFLVEGIGRMAIVVPNGILNNPALGYVRQWLLCNTQVVAVVDMARELFQPKNDTQTSMLLLRRLSATEREMARARKLDYPIFMAVAERVGRDKRGNIVYRQAPNGEDVIIVRAEEVSEVDPVTGLERTKKIQVKDRVVDDELPEVASAFRDWRAGQS